MNLQSGNLGIGWGSGQTPLRGSLAGGEPRNRGGAVVGRGAGKVMAPELVQLAEDDSEDEPEVLSLEGAAAAGEPEVAGAGA